MELEEKQKKFDEMLKTIAAYYLGLKNKQEGLKDEIDSLDLLMEVK